MNDFGISLMTQTHINFHENHYCESKIVSSSFILIWFLLSSALFQQLSIELYILRREMHYTSHSHLLQRIKIKMTFKDSYLSILFTVTKCLILEVQRTMYLHNDTPDKLALNGNNDVFFKRTWKEKKDKSLHGYFSILLDSGKSLRWHLKCCQKRSKILFVL